MTVEPLRRSSVGAGHPAAVPTSAGRGRTPGGPDPDPADAEPDAGRSWRSDRADFWLRSLRGWDIAFYALWVFGVAAVLLDPPATSAALGFALGALVVLLLAYQFVGRRAALTDTPGLALLYLLVMFVAVCVVVHASPTGTLLLFIAYSQVWYFAPSRRVGVLLTLVLTAGVFTTMAARDDVRTLADAGHLITQGGIAVAFSVLLGLWVTQVVEQSEERAELIARLEAAQAEAASSHHAAGVLAERERMAREIHDTLAQGFTSVVMLAQSAAADLDRDDVDAARDRLGLVERTARENLAEARALVAATAPVGLAGATVVEAVERLARRFAQETGIVVDVDVTPEVPFLSRDQEVVLLRAAQEALSNVRRHAGARRVQLVLEATDDAAVRMEIIDDGHGMPDGTAEGFGLRGMRQRVTGAGGSLAVTSGVDVGTRIQVSLPAGTAAPPSGGLASEVTR